MAYTYKNFRTKKALREALKQGETVNVFQPGPFPLNESETVYLEGPYAPRPHTWYAQAEVKDGKIIKLLK